jgi:hypothetical protein
LGRIALPASPWSLHQLANACLRDKRHVDRLFGPGNLAPIGGISGSTIDSALGGISYHPAIIARDHAQGVFHQSFEQFSGRMLPTALAGGTLWSFGISRSELSET